MFGLKMLIATIAVVAIVGSLIAPAAAVKCYDCTNCNKVSSETNTCENNYCFKMDMGEYPQIR